MSFTDWPSAPPGLAGREVRLGNVRIELDAVARFVLNGEIAVLPEGAFTHHKVAPPGHPVCQFVNAELAHRRGGVGRGDRAHGTRGIVAGGPDVVEVREIGDFLRL